MTIPMMANVWKNIVAANNSDNGNKKLKYGDITKTVSNRTHIFYKSICFKQLNEQENLFF